MEIRIRARDLPCAAALADHARRRLFYALMHRMGHVERVDVRLDDVPDPSGRRGRYCVIQVRLAGLPAATVVNIAASLSEAIDRAADRAARLVNGQILAASRAIGYAGASRHAPA